MIILVSCRITVLTGTVEATEGNNEGSVDGEGNSSNDALSSMDDDKEIEDNVETVDGDLVRVTVKLLNGLEVAVSDGVSVNSTSLIGVIGILPPGSDRVALEGRRNDVSND